MDRRKNGRKNRSNIPLPSDNHRDVGKRTVSPGTIITVARSFHDKRISSSRGGEDSFHGDSPWFAVIEREEEQTIRPTKGKGDERGREGRPPLSFIQASTLFALKGGQRDTRSRNL